MRQGYRAQTRPIKAGDYPKRGNHLSTPFFIVLLPPHYPTLGKKEPWQRKGEHLQPEQKLLTRPKTLADYRLLRVLHESENAVVFLGENPAGKQAAIKRFKFAASQVTPQLVQDFIQRSRLLGEGRMHHLARPLDAGLADGSLYLVMEYIEGKTLRWILATQAKPHLSQALLWFEEIALALGHIHSKGLVHQDLKTENIIVQQNKHLVLLDFGLETQLLVTAGFIRADEIYCTPYYVSPERILGDPPDARADLYALGVILYELLVGSKPYEADSLDILLKKHLIAPIPHLPPALNCYQPLLDGLLAKFPEHRLPSASSALQLLHNIMAQHPIVKS